MEDIGKVLRNGVRKIISVNSPPGSTEKLSEFRSSTHPAREVCFVVAGESFYMFNGNVYEASPGMAFVIDSWVPHAFGYRKCDNALLHLWMHFSPDNRRLQGAHFLRVGPHGDYRIEFKRIAFAPDFGKVLIERWDRLRDGKFSPDEVSNYLRGPLNFVLDEVLFQLTHDEKPATGEGQIIESVKKHIQMANGKDCSYRQLEKVSGYSSFYLAHLFRQREGVSIGEYIDQVRSAYILAAQKRGLKQKEIAFELGFSSPSNFWNWLKKHRSKLEDLEQ